MPEHSDSAETDSALQGVDADRLAGRVWEVSLHYTVEYRQTVIAGPDEYHAVEEAKISGNPDGATNAFDWELIHKDVEAIEDIWMDDRRAPRAVGWLDEPHVPSEDTYWDDSRHFDDVDDPP